MFEANGSKQMGQRKKKREKKREKSEFRSCVKVEAAVLDSPVPNSNSRYGLCGCTATLNEHAEDFRAVTVPNSPYGLCGRNTFV